MRAIFTNGQIGICVMYYIVQRNHSFVASTIKAIEEMKNAAEIFTNLMLVKSIKGHVHDKMCLYITAKFYLFLTGIIEFDLIRKPNSVCVLSHNVCRHRPFGKTGRHSYEGYLNTVDKHKCSLQTRT